MANPIIDDLLSSSSGEWLPFACRMGRGTQGRIDWVAYALDGLDYWRKKTDTHPHTPISDAEWRAWLEIAAIDMHRTEQRERQAHVNNPFYIEDRLLVPHPMTDAEIQERIRRFTDYHR